MACSTAGDDEPWLFDDELLALVHAVHQRGPLEHLEVVQRGLVELGELFRIGERRGRDRLAVARRLAQRFWRKQTRWRDLGSGRALLGEGGGLGGLLGGK